MADKSISSDNMVVKKANDLIRARLIGLQNKTASRITACLIAQIKTDDNDLKQTYKIRLSDYLSIGKSEKTDFLQLAKEACRNLAKTFAEIPLDTKGNFKEVPFFSEIKYQDGIVYAIFNKRAEPYLIKLQGLFTEYNVIEYIQLPSQHSQRIFEILKSYENGLDKGYIDITLDDLRFYLDISDRLVWRDFKKRVLDKAHEDINKYTSLKYNWIALKTGRKITSVRFTIIKEKVAEAKKHKKPLALPDKAEVLPDNAVTAKAVACAMKHKNRHCRHDKGETCKKCDELGLHGEDATGGLQPAGAILAGMMGKEGKA